MRKPHVLIIVENLPVPFDRRVWNEARALRETGYEVSVISPTGPNAEKRRETIEGIEIYRHPLPEARGTIGYFSEYASALYWEYRLAHRVNRKKKVDVVHACNPPDLIFLIGRSLKRRGAKFVFDHHDLNPELFEAKFGKRGLLYRAVCWLERQTFRTADISIATNDSYRRIAIQRGQMPAEKVFVVRSGPDQTLMRLVPANPKWKNGRKYLIAYVGVMGAQEGISYLLEAVRHIVHDLNRRDIQFCLVGKGPEFEALQHEARDLMIADFITFTGRVPDDVLVEVLNTADVCVNPDAVNPMNDMSTMNKIMEYMAIGKPIVQFELHEGRFSAEDSSLYAKPNDAADFGNKILALLDNPEWRSRMGAFGAKRVRDVLAWDYERPKLLAAYASLGLHTQV
jgi:glycosyltransferase involved in cell wall biosynthesis